MEEKVMEIIYNACDDKVIYKNKNMNLFETGLLDSMEFIELLITLEEEFDIEIEPAEISKDKMNTSNQLIEFIRRKING